MCTKHSRFWLTPVRIILFVVKTPIYMKWFYTVIHTSSTRHRFCMRCLSISLYLFLKGMCNGNAFLYILSIGHDTCIYKFVTFLNFTKYSLQMVFFSFRICFWSSKTNKQKSSFDDDDVHQKKKKTYKMLQKKFFF